MKTITEKHKNIYIVPAQKKERHKKWRTYIIPTGWKRKKNVSEHIDKMLYGI